MDKLKQIILNSLDTAALLQNKSEAERNELKIKFEEFWVKLSNSEKAAIAFSCKQAYERATPEQVRSMKRNLAVAALHERRN